MANSAKYCEQTLAVHGKAHRNAYRELRCIAESDPFRHSARKPLWCPSLQLYWPSRLLYASPPHMCLSPKPTPIHHAHPTSLTLPHSA